MSGQLLRHSQHFSIAHFGLYRGDDVARELVLDSEYVFEVAIVAVCPHVVTRQTVDKLRGYADAVPRLANATFEDVAHAQVFRYLSHIG